MPGGRYPWAVRAGGPLLGGGGALPVLFGWNPETAQTLPTTATFARASVAQVLTTTDGSTFWYQEAKSGELRLGGMRRVENLLDSATGSGPFTAVAKDGRLAVSVIASSGTLTITIGGTPQVFTPTGTPQRFVAFDDATGGSTTVAISGTATLSQPMAHLCQVGNDIPEPYVQHDAEFLNIGVNGVTYFNTANTSTVDGSGVVTEATGTTITGGGFFPELAATNQILESSDIADAAWTKTNLSPGTQNVEDIGLAGNTLDAGVAAGVAHTATAVVSSSATRTMYVIAKAGTGQFLTVRTSTTADEYAVFDLSGGSITATGAGATSHITDLTGGWYKCEVSSTVGTGTTGLIGISDTGTPGQADPTFNGANETILVHHAQFENTVFSTSPIVTAGSTMTRVADDLKLITFAQEDYTFVIDITTPYGVAQPTMRITNTDNFNAFLQTTAGLKEIRYIDNGTLLSGFNVEDNIRYKIGVSRDLSDKNISINGLTTVTGGGGSSQIGRTFFLTSGNLWRAGPVHNVIIYEVKLSASDLEDQTS